MINDNAVGYGPDFFNGVFLPAHYTVPSVCVSPTWTPAPAPYAPCESHSIGMDFTGVLFENATYNIGGTSITFDNEGNKWVPHEVVEQRKTIQALNAKAADLLAERTQTKTAHGSEVADLEQANQSLAEELEKVYSDQTDSRKEIQALKDQVRHVEWCNRVCLQVVSDRAEQVETLKKDNQELKTANQSLYEALTDQGKAMDKLDAERDLLRSESSSLWQANGYYENFCKDMRTILGTDYSTNLRDVAKALVQERNTLREQYAALVNQRCEAESKLKELAKVIDCETPNLAERVKYILHLSANRLGKISSLEVECQAYQQRILDIAKALGVNPQYNLACAAKALKGIVSELEAQNRNLLNAQEDLMRMK